MQSGGGKQNGAGEGRKEEQQRRWELLAPSCLSRKSEHVKDPANLTLHHSLRIVNILNHGLTLTMAVPI